MKRVLIITGDIDSGKTTELKRTMEEYRRRGARVDGVLTEAVMKGGRKVAYHLLRVGTRRRLLAAERRGLGGDPARSARADGAQRGGAAPQTPGFRFYRGSFEAAAGWIEEAGKSGAEVICVDELGPLESRGEGHWPAVVGLTAWYAGELVVTVRESLLGHFVSRFEELGLRPDVRRVESGRGGS